MKLLKIAALALGVTVLPASATVALISPSTAPAGSSFDVTVRLTDVFATHPGDALAAFGFDVLVGSPSVINYTGATIGPLFEDFSGIFGASPQVAGIPTIGFLVATDFTEPLILATLHFTAVTPGPSTIAIAANLSDPNQGLLYSEAGADSLAANTTVNVTDAVPEPGTAVLGGLALVSMLLYRRRAKL